MVVDNIHQLLSWRPAVQSAIIGEGILLPKTRIMVFGQAKSWKSMLSIYTAFQLATGAEWFGFETSPVTAFKFQAELPKAIDRDRVEKYAKAANSFPPNVFFKTSIERTKLDTTWGIAALTKDIEEVKSRSPNSHVVVILDPLYKLMAGHISDEYDVKKFQDNVDDLRERLDLSFIIIHHSRLQRVDSSGKIVDLGHEEAMGSSYWNNWCDTMVRVKLLNPYAGSDKVEISFELARNAQTILPRFQVHWSRYNLQPVVIGRAIEDFEEPSVRHFDKGPEDAIQR